MPETLTTRRGGDVTDILFSAGTLFHLYIGRWTGNKKLHESDLLLEGMDHSAVYIGHKKLLPKEAQESLQYIEGQARSYLSSRSMPFPIGASARYVSYHALREVLAKLREFRTQWDAAVNDLAANYARFMEDQLVRLDRQSQALMDKELAKVAPYAFEAKRKELAAWMEEQGKKNRLLYPNVADLKAKFAFEWRMFKLSPVEGSETFTDVDAATLLQEQDRIKQDLNRWVGEVSVLMHQELGQAAAQAKRILEDNGKLNPKNLRPLFDAFETFSAVNFAGPSQFQDVINSIRSRYLQRDGAGVPDWQNTAAQVNNATDEMRSLLSTIAELAVDETAKKAGVSSVRAGQFGRVIDID